MPLPNNQGLANRCVYPDCPLDARWSGRCEAHYRLAFGEGEGGPDELTCIMCGTRGEGINFAHECRHADAATLAELATARAEIKHLKSIHATLNLRADSAERMIVDGAADVERLTKERDDMHQWCVENHTDALRAEKAEAEVETLRAELAESRRMFELHRISVASSMRSELDEIVEGIANKDRGRE